MMHSFEDEYERDLGRVLKMALGEHESRITYREGGQMLFDGKPLVDVLRAAILALRRD